MAHNLEKDSWLLRFRWIMPLALLPLAILAALQADIAASGHLGRSLRDVWEVLCLAVAFTGLAIRVLAVGFGEDGPQRRMDDALPSTGMYSIVRYPLYLGTYVSLLGLSLLPGAIWFPLAVSAVFFLWYGRLVQQTELALKLRHGGRRREATTPPLLLPNPLLWRQPSGRFSIRRALRREYNDFYFVVASFVGLELACDLLGERLAFRQWLTEDLHWALLLAIGTLLYVALRPSGAAFPEHTRAGLAPVDVIGPKTRGIRVDRRVRSVDILENLISVGHLRRILDATLDAAMLSPNQRLLDVGCGSGKLAIRAASLAGGSIQALGIDATPGMIALAHDNAREARSHARFQVGVGEALPVPDGSVNAVASSYFLHHLPSDVKREALREMWRALAPGGRLVVTDYGKPTSLIGQIAAIPMRFNFHEHVRGQLAGELEAIIHEEGLGRIERLHSFIGYINVIRIVKPR